MKYAHTDENGRLIGWYDSDIHENIPEPNVAVSVETWQNAINNNHNTVINDATSYVDYRTEEEKSQDIRITRNMLLETDVDPVVTNPLRWNDLTAEKQQEWIDYRQALLDVPQQATFPNEVTWPIKPQ